MAHLRDRTVVAHFDLGLQDTLHKYTTRDNQAIILIRAAAARTTEVGFSQGEKSG
jgi:hypothetical protein